MSKNMYKSKITKRFFTTFWNNSDLKGFIDDLLCSEEVGTVVSETVLINLENDKNNTVHKNSMMKPAVMFVLNDGLHLSKT